ncbi:MAG: NHL repeat-containing protein [Planctomycetaceae bacterium]
MSASRMPPMSSSSPLAGLLAGLLLVSAAHAAEGTETGAVVFGPPAPPLAVESLLDGPRLTVEYETVEHEIIEHDAAAHDPIDLDVRPSIVRYQAAFISPRRMLLDRRGDLLIADWGAGTVVRLDADGAPSILVAGLDEPAGLALDDYGNLYVAQHGGGMLKSGSILKVAPDGMHSLHAAGLGGPTDLAFGPDGMLYVAAFHDDAIVRIDADGMIGVVADDIPGPAALVFDDDGALFVASSTSGSIFRIGPMSERHEHARGLDVPSDLAFDSKGHLIVANYGGNMLSYVDRQGSVRPFAVVPKGTIGHLFDRDDNLVLANWDQHYLMKVITAVTIPCPHCGRQVPVRFRPKPESMPPMPPSPLSSPMRQPEPPAI